MLSDFDFEGRDYRIRCENTACFVGRDVVILEMARDGVTNPSRRKSDKPARPGLLADVVII